MKNISISRRSTIIFLIVISYAQFVVLGLPGGYLGEAWPSMNTEFALAGLVLLYKRLGGSLNLVWQLLVFFTGALAPIQQPTFATLARVLPLTWGIECLRAVFIDKATFHAILQNGLILGLLINTTFYVALGVICFNWGERQARLQGVLAHY